MYRAQGSLVTKNIVLDVVILSFILFIESDHVQVALAVHSC